MQLKVLTQSLHAPLLWLNITATGGGYRGGLKGVMAPTAGQACPIKSHKSAPARAHFTEKMPQLGNILQRECPSWGIYWGKSAPTGSNFAENVPHVVKFIHTFCPTFSLGPSPSEFCIHPWPHMHHQFLWRHIMTNVLDADAKVEASPKWVGHGHSVLVLVAISLPFSLLVKLVDWSWKD